jgi:hypothetical protein
MKAGDISIEVIENMTAIWRSVSESESVADENGEK